MGGLRAPYLTRYLCLFSLGKTRPKPLLMGKENQDSPMWALPAALYFLLAISSAPIHARLGPKDLQGREERPQPWWLTPVKAPAHVNPATRVPLDLPASPNGLFAPKATSFIGVFLTPPNLIPSDPHSLANIQAFSSQNTLGFAGKAGAWALPGLNCFMGSGHTQCQPE